MRENIKIDRENECIESPSTELHVSDTGLRVS